MLRLRKMVEPDIYKVLEWRMLPEVTKYMYTDIEGTKESQKKWFDRVSTSSKYRYWMIEFDETDIGVLNLYDINQVNKRCFWAYYIADTSFRGKGIGRDLECNLYNYVFNFMKFNKLCCEVFEFNDKVIKIHEKFGSKIEGVFKEHIFKNGAYHNVVRMAILRDEWYAIRDGYQFDNIEIE